MSNEPKIPEWVCENIFCNMRDICSSWTNCLNCPARVRFVNFALSNKQPSKTRWGRDLQGRLDKYKTAMDKWKASHEVRK